MASVTFALDNELKKMLSNFSWINFSRLATEELIKKEDRLKQVREFERIISKSRLTEDDANRLADEINESLSKKYLNLLKKGKL